MPEPATPYSPPHRPPTSHDVAAAAGVSQPTVSRALRGDPQVAALTRERVLLAAAQLGYVSSDRGRTLATRRTGRVAVVVEELDNPFYLELLDALHGRLERADVRMVVLTSQTDAERVERLVDGSVDGVVLTTTRLHSTLPAELEARRFPHVLLNRVVDRPAERSCSVDNRAGAHALAAEVARRGHRHVGAILGPAETSTGRDRERGLREGLAARALDLPDAWVRRGPFTHRAGHASMHELLRGTPRPTAVVCGNDVVAIGALNAARGLGVRVPEDVSVVGFDDIGMAAWESFRLTTMRQDVRRMADTASDLLLERIDDPAAPPRRVVLAADLVARHTLGPPPRTRRA